ncbi:hypothetical protein [Methylobacterium sp. PvR107]|uniref:hypothetical protein n=1 Tax=Methylobacterium sp. PvR107 TaxID=2806597 RepID=UPI001AE773A6|nr:hypothetical protein [Methylobacterium sp. PvR107]MBP1179371.1 hypothetical protein [Methylobacterium sp. PvR107]
MLSHERNGIGDDRRCTQLIAFLGDRVAASKWTPMSVPDEVKGLAADGGSKMASTGREPRHLWDRPHLDIGIVVPQHPPAPPVDLHVEPDGRDARVTAAPVIMLLSDRHGVYFLPETLVHEGRAGQFRSVEEASTLHDRRSLIKCRIRRISREAGRDDQAA